MHCGLQGRGKQERISNQGVRGLHLGKIIQAVGWGMHWAGSESREQEEPEGGPVEAVPGLKLGGAWWLERRGPRRMLKPSPWRGGRDPSQAVRGSNSSWNCH